MANKAKDLASGTLSSSISASSTSISVSCGSGSDLALLGVWPTPPFYITVMPANPSASVANSLDSEIMMVSALDASDGIVNMSVSRGQRGTTAKAFSAGDIVSHAVYAEDAVLLGDDGTAVNPQPWIEASDIKNGAVTTDKIDWTTFGSNEHIVGYYNNQPIYEQTIEYTLPASMTNPASINIPHGIPNLGYMLDIAMTIVLPDGRSLMATKGIGDNVIDYLATLSLWVINSGNIVFKQQGMKDTIQGRPCIITMKYTKN